MVDETIEMKETGLGNYCSMLAKNTLQSRKKLISILSSVDYQVRCQANYLSKPHFSHV